MKVVLLKPHSTELERSMQINHNNIFDTCVSSKSFGFLCYTSQLNICVRSRPE